MENHKFGADSTGRHGGSGLMAARCPPVARRVAFPRIRVNSAMVFKRPLWIAIVSLLTLALFGVVPRAKAGPFEKFFRSLKHAFTRPEHRRSSHHSSHQRTTEKGKSREVPNSTATAPPDEHNARPAAKAHAARVDKGDFPYAIPVPGKKGYVTSPFAPDSGYIDVRAFPPGTAVKDPYTGKVFLTP
jgi:hypothetical protein